MKAIITTLLAVAAMASAAADKPNIILIVTDDQGYADAGFRNPEVHTPNLDQLVASGAELKRFYAAPVCSPTRAGLMTGLYPIRFGMQRAVNRPHSEVGLPEELVTLPEALGEAGYKERHIVGKWHLGNMRRAQLPMNHGFTHQYGPYCSGIDYFDHTRNGVRDFHRNQQPIQKDGYYTDLLSDEVVRIINHHQGDAPFFIYLPHGAPHTPLQAPEDEIARYDHLPRDRATYLAMITIIDHGLGRIFEALDRKGISDNTLIVFFSDNGGSHHGDNRPLSGRKGSLYEGGIRVIAAARWPARIPAGAVIETPGSYLDILPTLIDAAGVSVPEGMELDGRSLLPDWQQQPAPAAPQFEFYSFFETRQPRGESLSLIEGDWKLIRQGPTILDGLLPEGATIRLFDLSRDIGEQTDIAEEHPGRVARMVDKLVAFRELRPEGGVPPMTDPVPRGWRPPVNWDPVE